MRERLLRSTRTFSFEIKRPILFSPYGLTHFSDEQVPPGMRQAGGASSPPRILAILSQLTGAGVAAGTRYLNSFAIQVQEVYADHLLIKATGSVMSLTMHLVLVSMIFRKAGNRSIVRFSRQLFPLR